MLDELDIKELKKANRIKNKYSHHKSKFWCGKCDAQFVGETGKCPNCGHRENRKKIKL